MRTRRDLFRLLGGAMACAALRPFAGAESVSNVATGPVVVSVPRDGRPYTIIVDRFVDDPGWFTDSGGPEPVPVGSFLRNASWLPSSNAPLVERRQTHRGVEPWVAS